jgi:hypothetical protein
MYRDKTHGSMFMPLETELRNNREALLDQWRRTTGARVTAGAGNS